MREQTAVEGTTYPDLRAGPDERRPGGPVDPDRKKSRYIVSRNCPHPSCRNLPLQMAARIPEMVVLRNRSVLTGLFGRFCRDGLPGKDKE